jgi:hypothetical protein
MVIWGMVYYYFNHINPYVSQSLPQYLMANSCGTASPVSGGVFTLPSRYVENYHVIQFFRSSSHTFHGFV